MRHRPLPALQDGTRNAESRIPHTSSIGTRAEMVATLPERLEEIAGTQERPGEREQHALTGLRVREDRQVLPMDVWRELRRSPYADGMIRRSDALNRR